MESTKHARRRRCLTRGRRLPKLRASFEGLLARAIAEGLPAPSCTGLHPDTVAAIDAVAFVYPAAPPRLVDAARVSFARNEKTWR